VALPATVFERTAYRLDSSRRPPVAPRHPLLGERRVDDEGAVTFTRECSSDASGIAGHRVGGVTVVPFAAYVDMAVAAAREGEPGAALEALAVHEPLALAAGVSRTLRVAVTGPAGARGVRIESMDGGVSVLFEAHVRTLSTPLEAESLDEARTRATS